ncbi:unnamed protein product [Parnassius apollo]|uniref:(apollo) hypothetical protein n=1 Tax=Parnassius apollo TaxID=110799 RepID=A0A8S3X3V8_PARAO|nr:unnamed protein product [Parnassius apollo]
MSSRRRRVLGAKPYRNYSEDTLKAAMAAVDTGMTLREAEEKFKIPRATLNRKHRRLQLNKVGRPKVFSEALEEVFVQSIVRAAAWGYPLSGRYWLEGFLRRHKSTLSVRLSENIKRQRAGVTQETLKSYFQELKTTLEDVDPAAIVNFDETNISDDPGRQKVLVRRGIKHAHKIIDSSKSSTSVMFAGTASGVLLPPYVVYKAEHLYNTWTEGGPPNTVYNRSRSGWFDTTIFEDWCLKVIIPYVESFNGRGPMVVIGDNLSSHISLDVIQKCTDYNIKFVCLPANSTGLCQPLDVAVFRLLKIKWSDLEEWREAVLNTANSSSDDNNEFDTVFFDDVHDMFPDDDERSASPLITNIPPNENQENEDPLNVDQSVYTDEQFKVSVPSDGGAGCSKDIDTEIVNNSEISPDSFAVVELLCNENTKKQTEKKFIAQITNMVSDGKVTCRFMKCFSATKVLHLFPTRSLSQEQKENAVKMLQRRWKNLRACFSRELRSQKDVKSGQAAPKRKRYVYFNKLLFLVPSMEPVRETSSNVTSLDKEAISENDSSTPAITRPTKEKKKNKSYEESLLDILRDKTNHQDIQAQTIISRYLWFHY